MIVEEIDCYQILETKYSKAFLDINPVAEGHILIIPKYHGKHLQDISDQYLTDILPAAKRLARVLQLEGNLDEIDGSDNFISYNILQNNGKLAGQEVVHVHFHFIPKRDTRTGLQFQWPKKESSPQKLLSLRTFLVEKLEKN